MIQLKKKHNRIEISLASYRLGGDLCVFITGGDSPHLGAVTAASQSREPRTVAFDTHKENYVTEMAAELLRKSFSGNFVVCCGIHLDNIEKQEIDDIMQLSEMLIKELCGRLKNENGE